jgi:hypothetical protein
MSRKDGKLNKPVFAPQTLVKSHEQNVVMFLESLLGKELSGVEYVNMPGAQHPFLWEDRQPMVEPVDIAVLFSFAEVALRVDWAMDTGVEGLSVLDASQTGLGEFGVMNASSTPLWEQIVGKRLTGFGIAWFNSGLPDDDAALALRMSFGTVRRFLLLASAANGVVVGMPDELTVVGDSQIADNVVAEAHGYWQSYGS